MCCRCRGWAFADNVSVIQTYSLCVGTAAGANDVLPCTNIGLTNAILVNVTALGGNSSLQSTQPICVNVSTPTGPLYTRFNVTLNSTVTVCNTQPVSLFATVIASDPAGNTASSSSPAFIVDSTPPLAGTLTNSFTADNSNIDYTTGYSRRRTLVEADWTAWVRSGE